MPIPESFSLAAPGSLAALSNATLATKAFVQRWPIKPDIKLELIEIARQKITDPTTKARERLMWGKLLLAAEAQNQSDEQRQAEYDRLDQGKLTGNTGHTVILDGPIRPQVKKIDSSVVGPEATQISQGAPADLPPPHQITQINTPEPVTGKP